MSDGEKHGMVTIEDRRRFGDLTDIRVSSNVAGNSVISVRVLGISTS